ncbi:unnamed protein product, partial [Urochloa humidicola]
PSPSPILASYPSHSSLSLSLSLSAASEGSRRASSPARVADERGSSISCPHPPAVRAPSPSWAAGRGVNHKMELVNVVSGMDRVRVPTYKDKDVNWILVRDILWSKGVFFLSCPGASAIRKNERPQQGFFFFFFFFDKQLQQIWERTTRRCLPGESRSRA